MELKVYVPRKEEVIAVHYTGTEEDRQSLRKIVKLADPEGLVVSLNEVDVIGVVLKMGQASITLYPGDYMVLHDGGVAERFSAEDFEDQHKEKYPTC